MEESLPTVNECTSAARVCWSTTRVGTRIFLKWAIIQRCRCTLARLMRVANTWTRKIPRTICIPARYRDENLSVSMR